MKSVFLKFSKNGRSESLAAKTTYLTHYVSYLNLEGEVSSFKNEQIYRQFKFKLEVGVASSIFELPTSNFGKLYIFWMFK